MLLTLFLSYCNIKLNFLPAFGRMAFRIDTKIFATLQPEKQVLMVKLSPEEQSVFCIINNEIMYPVPGSRGLRAALVALKVDNAVIVRGAFHTACKTIATGYRHA